MYLVFAVVLVLVVVRLVVAEGQKLAHYLVVMRMRRPVGRSRSVVLVMARSGWVRRGVLPFCFFGARSCAARSRAGSGRPVGEGVGLRSRVEG